MSKYDNFFQKKLRNSRASQQGESQGIEKRNFRGNGSRPHWVGGWRRVSVSHDLVVASAFSLVCTAGGLLNGDGKPLLEIVKRWEGGWRGSELVAANTNQTASR